MKNAHTLQYADDSLIYSADKISLNMNSKVSQNIQWLAYFFEKHHLTLNANKTEFSFFKQNSKNVQVPVGINIKAGKSTAFNLVK